MKSNMGLEIKAEIDEDKMSREIISLLKVDYPSLSYKECDRIAKFSIRNVAGGIENYGLYNFLRLQAINEARNNAYIEFGE